MSSDLQRALTQAIDQLENRIPGLDRGDPRGDVYDGVIDAFQILLDALQRLDGADDRAALVAAQVDGGGESRTAKLAGAVHLAQQSERLWRARGREVQVDEESIRVAEDRIRATAMLDYQFAVASELRDLWRRRALGAGWRPKGHTPDCVGCVEDGETP